MSILLVLGPLLGVLLHARHPLAAAGFATPSLAYIVLICALIIAEKMKRRLGLVVVALGLVLFVFGITLEQFFLFKLFTAGVSLSLAAFGMAQHGRGLESL